MAIFHLPQFEHESFWQYLFRLNGYYARQVHFMYENIKNMRSCARGDNIYDPRPLKSMCYGGMCYLSVDYLWDLFESLASY